MTVQTGANSQDGGLKEGLTREVYQPAICGCVTIAAAKPMASVMSKLTSKGKKLNFGDWAVVCMLISITINRVFCLTAKDKQSSFNYNKGDVFKRRARFNLAIQNRVSF